ncbi:hypothetical protein ACPC54_25530 [Kitasatospora sp. NPDC094028]
MNHIVEAKRVEDAGEKALERLAHAVRQPTSRALDNAKALFPFIADETATNDDESAARPAGTASRA